MGLLSGVCVWGGGAGGVGGSECVARKAGGRGELESCGREQTDGASPLRPSVWLCRGLPRHPDATAGRDRHHSFGSRRQSSEHTSGVSLSVFTKRVIACALALRLCVQRHWQCAGSSYSGVGDCCCTLRWCCRAGLGACPAAHPRTTPDRFNE
jgi:hypothetical protein